MLDLERRRFLARCPDAAVPASDQQQIAEEVNDARLSI